MARTIQKSSPIPDSNAYSLWFIPRGPIYRRLSKAIVQLSQAFEKPRFHPHVTLLDGISGPEEIIIAQTVKLADILTPIKVNLSKMSGTDEYFRCLFLQVEQTDNIMKAHQLARKIFNLEQEDTFMPHLSLMYGHYPKDAKKAIIAKIENALLGDFIADHLYLYNTSEAPDTWSQIRAYTLA